MYDLHARAQVFGQRQDDRHREVFRDGRAALRVCLSRGAAGANEFGLHGIDRRRVLAVKAVAQTRVLHGAHHIAQPHFVGAPQARELVQTRGRRRLQERLERDGARLGLPGDVVEVLVAGAAVQRVVDDGGRLEQRRTLAKRWAGIGRQLRDRHLEDRRDAAGRGRRGAREEVLALGHARVPGVDVRVDDAGQDVVSCGVEDFSRVGRHAWLKDRGDASVGYRDVRLKVRIMWVFS